eukprot:scaffold8881_cov199-Skeletonema_marinoi.AAC.10
MAYRAASVLAAGASKYGALWGRGYETFKNRRILSVSGVGDHATTYLQGLVTADLNSEPSAPREEVMDSVHALNAKNSGMEPGAAAPDDEPEEEEVPVQFTKKLRSATFLDHRGRILTDALLWKRNPEGADSATTEYLIDVPDDTGDLLLAHLKQHKLRRSKIKLADKTEEITSHAVYGTLNAEGAPPGYIAGMDPRHPSLGMRILSVGQDILNTTEGESERAKRQQHFETLMNNFFPSAPGTYAVLRKLAGIAEGTEIASKTALECNQDFLNAISFSKGCYLGQELTARSQFTGVVRKRIVPVMIVDTEMEVPKPWVMASMIQELGTEEGMDKIFGLSDEDGEKKKLALAGYIPPPLPKISAPGAGSIVSMMMGSVAAPDQNPQDGSEGLNKLRVQGEKLQTEIAELAQPGTSIIDKKDSRTIGKILSTPAPGTTVLLAQMRLDRLGLLGSEHKWSRTNKILIGDSNKEYRFLPFLPLWWPDIDPATGKEKEVDVGE